MVVDYDIFNRVVRAFLSDSLVGYFDVLQRNVIIFQAPWHIFKTLAISMWKYFAPFIFADLWIEAYQKRCPADPDLKDILPFYIVLFQITSQTEWPVKMNKNLAILKRICSTLLFIVLGLGQSIQTSDVDTFFTLLKYALPWFKRFGCTNYFKSCTVSLVLWDEWNQMGHPVVGWLKKNFKATSEEYGETHIQVMNSHIKDHSFELSRLTVAWKMTSIALSIFEEMDIHPSHRQSSAKKFDIHSPNDVYVAIYKSFRKLYRFMADDNHLPFVQQSTQGYTSESARSENIRKWIYLSSANLNGLLQKDIRKEILKVHSTLRGPIDAGAWANDLDWAA